MIFRDETLYQFCFWTFYVWYLFWKLRRSNRSDFKNTVDVSKSDLKIWIKTIIAQINDTWNKITSINEDHPQN